VLLIAAVALGTALILLGRAPAATTIGAAAALIRPSPARAMAGGVTGAPSPSVGLPHARDTDSPADTFVPAATPSSTVPSPTASGPGVATSPAFATLGPGAETRPVPRASQPADGVWPTFDGDASRSGINRREHLLNPGDVAHLTAIWSRHLPGPVDSAPVYGDHRLYLTLTNGGTVAVDADSGRLLWAATTRGPRFTTSSPVLDPSGAWVYSYGLDGSVHRYAAATGREDRSGGWPVRVTAMPNDEKGSSALNLADGRLYATMSGYPSDGGHYEGHLVVIDLETGRATIFNALCSNLRALLGDRQGAPNYCAAVHGGVWARAGTVVDPATGRLFLATGDGPWDGLTSWGNSVLALSPDGRTLLDSYTPTDQQALDGNDADLGSSAPALLPEQPSSATPTMLLEASKDGRLRLLNRRDLSGRGRPGQLGGALQVLDAPKGCEVRTTPVAWVAPDGNSWVFVADDCALGGYALVTNAKRQSRLVPRWLDSPGASSPVLANGVLYLARGQAVQARDPLSGRVLWSSDQVGGALAGTHWQSPIVADGRVYVGDGSGNLLAFGMPGGP
jgi:outer membrane protein assembly factor BamB